MTPPIPGEGTLHAHPRRAAINLSHLSQSLHAVAGALIVSGMIVQLVIFTYQFLTPVNISGTLLGGMQDMAGGVLAVAGVLLAALLRLPGFRLAWIVAGGLPIILGTLALWSYPDDHGGSQIFSPPRSDIVCLMTLGGVFLFLGGILHRYISLPRPSGRRLKLLSIVFRLPLMAGMAALFIAVPIMRQIDRSQASLPPCAHDPAGRQLTLCLKAYVPPQEGTQ